MKKTITFFASFLICVGLSAQINPSQTTNGIMKKAVNNKVTMSGNEALSHLIANPNPTLKNIGSSTSNMYQPKLFNVCATAKAQNGREVAI